MRILQVIDSLTRGGAEQALVNLLPALARRGHQCEVAALWPPYPLASQLENAGIPVHQLDVIHRWNVLEGMMKVALLCHRQQYDVVHAHLFFSGLYVALSRPFVRRSRRVVLFHNLAYDAYPATTFRKKLRKALDGWVMRSGMDGWMAVSRSTAEHYKKHLRVADIVVIPVPVDLETFRPLLNANGGVTHLSAYGLTEGDFSIILPARFVAEKGHRFLIRAMELLRARNLYPKVLFFGYGPLKSEIVQEVTQGGLHDQVILHEALPNAELLAVVKDADIVVMPSTNEGLPLSALEAMALGRPLLATRVGGLLDLVEDHVSGLLVPPADPQALADGIEKLMFDPALRQSLGRAARRRIETCYSADIVAAQWERYYTQLIA